MMIRSRTLGRSAVFAASALLIGTRLCAQIVVSVENSQAPPASALSVCVDMAGSGNVSGIQMNINWDAQCLQVGTNGAEADCTKGSNTGRDTFKTRVLGTNSLKMIMLSISDTTPMPDNVQLFCCNFLISSSITGTRQCSVNLTDIIASDPKGVRAPNITPRNGTITVSGNSGDVTGSGTGIPAADGSAPVTSSTSTGGCRIDESPRAYLAWPVFALLFVILRQRRRG